MNASLCLVLVVTTCVSCAAPSGAPPAPQPPHAPTLAPESPPLEPPYQRVEVLTAEPSAPLPPPRPPSPAELHEWRERKLPGAVWPPPGYVPPACELELSTRATQRGKVYEVTAVARNKSAHPIELELPSRCPQGPIVFGGLPEGYDYYQTCAQGACAAPRDPLRFTLPPGEERELEAVELDPRGVRCTQALPPGSYSVTFSVPFHGVLCAASFAQVPGGPAPPPKAPPKPAPVVTCPPLPACGIACEGGRFAHDAKGCPRCGCEELRGVMPGEPGK